MLISEEERRIDNDKSDAVYMLDIETTGLDPVKDDILQVAVVEMRLEKGLYRYGGHYVRTIPSAKEPSEWAKQYPGQVALYDLCNRIHQEGHVFSPNTIRRNLTSFMGPKAKIVGINVTTFDLPFLVKKAVLEESDYHYQVFDMTGVIEYTMRVLSLSGDRETRDALKDKARELGRLAIENEERFPHTALADCLNQMDELNGYIIAGRTGLACLLK